MVKIKFNISFVVSRDIKLFNEGTTAFVPIYKAIGVAMEIPGTSSRDFDSIDRKKVKNIKKVYTARLSSLTEAARGVDGEEWEELDPSEEITNFKHSCGWKKIDCECLDENLKIFSFEITILHVEDYEESKKDVVKHEVMFIMKDHFNEHNAGTLFTIPIYKTYPLEITDTEHVKHIKISDIRLEKLARESTIYFLCEKASESTGWESFEHIPGYIGLSPTYELDVENDCIILCRKEYTIEGKVHIEDGKVYGGASRNPVTDLLNDKTGLDIKGISKIYTAVDSSTVGDLNLKGSESIRWNDSLGILHSEGSCKSIKNRKGDNKMKNLFGKFGKIQGDQFKASMSGIAVKSGDSYVTLVNDTITDVMDLVFDDEVFAIPTTIKDLKVGDLILVGDKAYFIKELIDGTITGIDIVGGTEDKLLPRTSVMGFSFYTKIISMMSMFTTPPQSAEGQAAPAFNPMMLMMMMKDSKDMSDLLPLMMMQNGGQVDPMTMMMLMKGDKDIKSMLPLMMMQNSGGNINPMMLMMMLKD